MIFIGSLTVSLLYSWLGLAYTGTLILILHSIGIEISAVVTVTLASQIITAFLGSLLRRKLSTNGDVKNPLLIAVVAIATYSSASLIDVTLSDNTRLGGIMVILVLTAILNIASKEGDPCSSRGGLLINVVAGLSSGVVKGVLGGGMTPTLIAIQRFGKIDIDETFYRTLLAQTIICLAALIPYTLAFGFDFKLFTIVSLGSITGVTLGYKIIAPISKELRVKLVSLIMVLLTLAYLIKFLLEVVCV